MRFIRGHNGRKAVRYVEEDRGYESPCWIWQLVRHRKTGYGQVRDGDRKVYAHRQMYEQARGPVPPGLELDHLCRVHACVNPDHLEPVTRQENVRRAVDAGAYAGPRPYRRKAAA